MRHCSIAGALLLVLVCGARELSACQCGEQPTLRAAVAASEEVFRARASITDTDEVEISKGFSWKVDTVVLKVSEVWKGNVPEILVIRSGLSSCDFPFQDGVDYLVFRSRAGVPEGLMVNECLPSQAFRTTLREQLGRAVAPRKLSFAERLRTWWDAL